MPFGGAEQRLVALETDIAPGVEVEIGDAVGQRRNIGVEGRVGQFARALDDVGVAEGGRRRTGRRASCWAKAGYAKRVRGRGDDAGENGAAGEVGHGVRAGWETH